MYGEGQNKNSLIAQLEIKIGEKEFKMSGGEQLQDYLYIKDVVSNILKIFYKKK